MSKKNLATWFVIAATLKFSALDFDIPTYDNTKDYKRIKHDDKHRRGKRKKSYIRKGKRKK